MIYSALLIVCLWIMCMQDAISRWMDEADFEEESRDDVPCLDEENDWGHNIKGYKHEKDESKGNN